MHADRAGATAPLPMLDRRRNRSRGDTSSGRRDIDGVGVVLDIGAVTRGRWPSCSGVSSVLGM